MRRVCTISGLILALALGSAGCFEPINNGGNGGSDTVKPVPITKMDKTAREVAAAIKKSKDARSKLALSMRQAIAEGKSQDELKVLWNTGDLAIAKEFNSTVSELIKTALTTADADEAEKIWQSVADGYAN